jgi:hypothetical protein
MQNKTGDKRERTVARKSKIIVAGSNSTLRRRYCIHLFFEPGWETDEFVRVVASKAAHRIGKQNVRHPGRKGSGSCCVIPTLGKTAES